MWSSTGFCKKKTFFPNCPQGQSTKEEIENEWRCKNYEKTNENEIILKKY